MLLGLLLVALAAISWGTTGATLELIGAASTGAPLVVGAMRMLIASPLLGTGALLAGDRLWPSRPGFVGAGLCMAAYQVCYFSAVPLAGVAATALLAICLAPILITLLARVLFKEHLTSRRLAVLAVGVLGAGLLVGGARFALDGRFLVGCTLAVGAAFAYSLYVVVTKRALSSSPPLALSALTFGLAAALLLPVLAVQPPALTFAVMAHGWPWLLYLGAVPTAAAYWLYTTGLRRIPASAAAVTGLLEPLTATLLGVALFHERPGMVGAFGVALLLLATVLLTAAPGGEERVARTRG